MKFRFKDRKNHNLLIEIGHKIMSERLLVHTVLDARDEVEDYWLKHKDQVLQQVKLPNPDLIDSDTSRLLIQACQQNNPDDLLVGACCIFILSKDDRVSQLWLIVCAMLPEIHSRQRFRGFWI